MTGPKLSHHDAPPLTMHPLLSAMTVMDQSKLTLVQRLLTL